MPLAFQGCWPILLRAPFLPQRQRGGLSRFRAAWPGTAMAGLGAGSSTARRTGFWMAEHWDCPRRLCREPNRAASVSERSAPPGGTPAP